MGGAPSTGSTLLADLVDAAPGALCGPEFNIFCVKDAYRFDEAFRRAAACRRFFDTEACYAPRSRFFNTRYLAQCGLDLAGLEAMIGASDGLRDFADRFARHFAAFRSRDCIVFGEKTPINVSQAARFAAAFPEAIFIHIVRDGRAVVASLLKRGYTLVEAALIWMVQTAAGRDVAAAYPNVVEIRFQDLVAAPYETAQRLLDRVGHRVDAADIERGYAANAYRGDLPRIGTWSASKYEGVIRPPPSHRDVLGDGQIRLLESLGLVRQAGPGAYDRSETFAGLLRHYGYAPESEAAASAGDWSIDDLKTPCAAYLAASENLGAQERWTPVIAGRVRLKGESVQPLADWMERQLRVSPRAIMGSFLRLGPRTLAQIGVFEMMRRTHVQPAIAF